MGLDIYVGSLTRYLTGGKGLIAIEDSLSSADAVPQPDTDALRAKVMAWREELSQALADLLSEPLDWNEHDEAPCFSELASWESYGDLMLWAAYSEQRELSRPDSHVEDWRNDPAYLASTAEDFPSKYTHLYGIEMWLPCPFGIVFKADAVGGAPVMIGSSLALLQQLEELNQRTWNAGPIHLSNWAHDGSEPGAPLERGAQRAFALMVKMTGLAVDEQLPMRLAE